MNILASLEVVRQDRCATVQVRVLFYHRGRDNGYYQNGAFYNDDPSEVQCASFGTVTETEEGFPWTVGQTLQLSEEEVRQAENTAAVC